MSNTQEEFMQKLTALLAEYEVSMEANDENDSCKPIIEIWGPGVNLNLRYIDEFSA